MEPATQQSCDDVLSENPDMDIGGGQTSYRVIFALIDRNFAEAERVLAASPREDFQDIDYSFYYPKAWFEAMIAESKRRFRACDCCVLRRANNLGTAIGS